MKYFALLITAFIFACSNHVVKEENVLCEELSYAKGFSIGYADGYKLLTVRNPWDTSKVLARYVLVDKGAELPDSLPEGILVRVPLERVAVFSTLHCGMLEYFGMTDKIVGVCEPEYIDVEAVKSGISNGTILNLGNSASPNVETLVVSSPEAMIVSPFQNQSYGAAAKLEIPIIECAAYMEQTPLGQAEWIKFHAAFLGYSHTADSLYDQIVERYVKTRETVSRVVNKPSLLVEQRYGQVWWVPAGDSYAASLYADAGASYIWADEPGSGSLALSFESVFDKASKADFWLIRYNNPKDELSYSSLENEFKSYKEFAAFKHRAVFGCNTAKTRYYERALFSPDIILSDLAKIFHPELFEDYNAIYYKPLQ